MAISLETIIVGVENQATGSDSLFTAFTKTQNNFSKLANTASPYNTFDGQTGIQTEAFSSNGTVKITNTGVINIIAGTGLTASTSNGNVVLSVSGSANGTLVAGVTNVGISSSTLNVSNSPVISNGVMTVNLPTISSITPGDYIAPTITLDAYGRITAVSNTESSGTVTSIAILGSDGIEVSGGPVTSSGEFTITNTGVTRLNAGPGISLSGHTGELTISSSNPVNGTVTSVEVTSNTLTITGSPITSTGTINIEMPETDSMTGTFTAGNLTSSGKLVSLGNANVVGTFLANGTATFNSNVSFGANVAITGTLSVTGNTTSSYFMGNGFTLSSVAGANVSGAVSSATSATTAGTVTTAAQPNITSVGEMISLTASGNILSNNIVAETYVHAYGGLLLESDNGNYVALSAQNGVGANYAWGLPVADGSNGSFMSTDGAGSLSFKQPASSSAPLTSGATGTAGQIAYDATHIYVCIATDTWKRADLASW